MYKADNLLKLVDPMLDGNFLRTEAVRFVKVALLCVQEKCGLRPSMSKAMKMMRGEIDIHNTQITQPGFIIDIMDVKIGRKPQSSVRNITSRRSPRLYPLRTVKRRSLFCVGEKPFDSFLFFKMVMQIENVLDVEPTLDLENIACKLN